MYGIISSNLISEIERACSNIDQQYGFKYTRIIDVNNSEQIIDYIKANDYQLLIIESSVFTTFELNLYFLTKLIKVVDCKIIYISLSKKILGDIVALGIYNIIYYNKSSLKEELKNCINKQRKFSDVKEFVKLKDCNAILIISIKQNNQLTINLIKKLIKKDLLLYNFKTYGLTDYLEELNYEFISENKFKKNQLTILCDIHNHKYSFEKMLSICHYASIINKQVIIDYGQIYPEDIVDIIKSSYLFKKIYLIDTNDNVITCTSSYIRLMKLMEQNNDNITVVNKKILSFKKESIIKNILKDIVENKDKT